MKIQTKTVTRAPQRNIPHIIQRPKYFAKTAFILVTIGRNSQNITMLFVTNVLWLFDEYSYWKVGDASESK